VKGEASISGYSTVMTAEVDKNSSSNVGKSLSAMTPDLFREFEWSDGADAFVQVAFPGLYPDLTDPSCHRQRAISSSRCSR